MNDCIFCKIAAGHIKSQLVHDDPRVMAFRDVNPQAPAHLLIIPKKHIERLSAMDESDLSIVDDIHRVIRKLVKEDRVFDGGFRVVVNNGDNGGQTVPHLHYHLLGGRQMTWPPG